VSSGPGAGQEPFAHASTPEPVLCPGCGLRASLAARFCERCGTLLADAPAETEERRVVTALFCDLAGFTAWSETTDPEEVQRMLTAYHAVVRAKVAAFGGRGEKLVGDGVLAVFGVPIVREDDPERAVRTGLAVVEALRTLSEQDPRMVLPVRVGVNTGLALVNLGGAAEAGGHWVSGDVINTASRLQNAAAPDTVLVGESTCRATALVFEYEELPPVIAKGKSEPVHARRAITAHLPFGAEIFLDLGIPLVGRVLELRQLSTAFDHVVRESAVQLVTIIGDPGVGKSRMVSELLATVPTDVTCRVGRVPPFGEATGFSALGEIVKAHAGVYDTDSAEEVTRKLRVALATAERREWLVALLLPLLGVEAAAEGSREESFEAWRMFLEHLAADGPAIAVIEDIHQADPGLLAFIQWLTEGAARVPLMLVVTARPELLAENDGWGGGVRNATLVNLLPLNDDETRSLLRSLVGAGPLPSETEQAILARAEGNPLFTAEFVRMLRDQELIEPVTNGTTRPFVDVHLPETIQGVIAARLDILEGHSRTVLQDAAVVGRVFWTSAVAAVGGRDVGEVAAELRRLARLDIVRPVPRSTMAGESEHSFTHTLLREAAYEQPRLSTRARKHLAAADWLETQAPRRADEFTEVLAYHASSALELATRTGDEALAAQARERLLRYYLQAADAAESVSATAKALAHVNAACRLAESDPVGMAALDELLERRRRLQRELGEDDAAQSPVPAGQHAHRPRLTGAPGSTATTRGRSIEQWEVLVSLDRAFYDSDIVDDEFPRDPAERRVPLGTSEVSIGRGREVTVNLAVAPSDPAVSRAHAVLRPGPTGWTITQVAPHNPTYLSGFIQLTPGEPVTVVDGDYVNMGGWTRITLRRLRR
jgi:class 3 adenylate cyclase